ncbi:enoyl-CoA hydratase [Xaviernesmea oryzae]|uniref:Enoyl-CoA hydratase n=1 Tax=Xaviernesmea oryzae TaxID=464029 RepID=A0A1Q9ATG2_9HYPH|nr:crotonase/enoyl-CoA hydratase family protein [Xaviernesmea oryzae]OLP58696.1 enoyl-CoA hydratase [Xaviernesmea oryzae]SEK68503.1 Enoyl-CoA hydratase/carnithine racemase [Xaviernesmea oryzae]
MDERETTLSAEPVPVRVERPQDRRGVQILRIERPEKKNALTRAMYRRMTEALVEADADDSLRVTVFLGQPGCFSAGNDMGDFAVASAGGDFGQEVIAFLKALASSRKPLISGVDGLAIGIGTTLHLHCDQTIATPRALFRTPFVDLGLVPEGGSSLLGPRLLGPQRAFSLLALGEPFTAAAAHAAGLVARIVEPEMLEEETLAAASAIAAKPPAALAAARRLLRGDPAALLACIDEEARIFAERLRSPETQGAIAAFLQR